jgi:hypothetical protein
MHPVLVKSSGSSDSSMKLSLEPASHPFKPTTYRMQMKGARVVIAAQQDPVRGPKHAKYKLGFGNLE